MQNDPFRIRNHVADFDKIVQDIVHRSQAVRATIPMTADIAYGPDQTETIDLFFPPGKTSGLPVHMFIHGGYWRMFSKRDYSYVAATITQAGAIAAIVDYALMPKVRMATIVDQVRRAKQWVLAHIADHGGNPADLTVSGHSAGAHLATFLFNSEHSPSNVRAALLLGGLYDLKPLQNSFLANEIAITDEEVARFTPLAHRHDPQTRAMVLVGANETPAFHQQADRFKVHLLQQGLPVTSLVLANRNHMDSVRDLGLPESQAGDCLTKLIANDDR
ncbi:alpha/beta hydrolase [Mesorhizobium sp.]|uniref:alpha/beta hydrolase n=1 Tax=Mesorhizobium sp. TaxID=1871066 RepID=UPI000FE95935|nr:alpha/beta hydrolase [Mesorhizobium sp.]RWN63283.1 MAG: alpha/beta hydrolase [Mesorhizobium sp.]RWO52804.1 MAG: alpha/beta hydrolase [Mesorhizobium sp.]TIN23445.1 MAG: alpha/beta hydrolase [Mesorhizobium sp.]TJU82467.1 MAG: alpha/beta hydrolase [Mesorhizobium sp.]